jgi:hypothetical protein
VLAHQDIAERNIVLDKANKGGLLTGAVPMCTREALSRQCYENSRLPRSLRIWF